VWMTQVQASLSFSNGFPGPCNGLAPSAVGIGSGYTKVCRHFLANRCHFGEQCHFSHDTSGAAYDAAPSTEVCRHFLANRCNFGDQCRFSHSVAGTLPKAMQAGGAVPSSSTVGMPPDVCRQFLQGRCLYGATCRFKHVLDSGGPLANAAASTWCSGPQGTPPQPLPWRAPAEVGPPPGAAEALGFCQGNPVAESWDPAMGSGTPVIAPGTGAQALGALPLSQPAATDGVAALSNYGETGTDAWYGSQLGGMSDGTGGSWPQSCAGSGQGLGPTGAGGICRHFLQGRCTYGEACRFPHVSGSDQDVPSTQQGYGKANTLFVGALPKIINEAEIHNHFSRFGTISNLEVKKDAMGLSRGFGFIDFMESGAVDAALAVPQSHIIDGRVVEVRRHDGRVSTPAFYGSAQQAGMPTTPAAGGAPLTDGLPPEMQAAATVAYNELAQQVTAAGGLQESQVGSVPDSAAPGYGAAPDASHLRPGPY